MLATALLLGCATQAPRPPGPAPAAEPEPPDAPDRTLIAVREPVSVTVEPEVRCATPAEREFQPYDDEWVGEKWVDGGGIDLLRSAKGAVVIDLDGDEIDDLFVPRFDDPSHLLLGSPSGFVPSDERLRAEISNAVGAAAADIDGDDDRDLFVYRHDHSPVIFRNSDGWFDAEPLRLPGELDDGCGGSASFADYDLDGDLDLLYGRLDRDDHAEPCGSALLANDGTGAFSVVEGALSPDVQRDRVMMGAWLPLDADPWPELYVVTDAPAFLPGNRVLDNLGGVLTQVDGHPLNVSLAGMGVAVADLQDDGAIDVFVPGIAEYAMLAGVGDGLWVDAAQAWGLLPDLDRGQRSAWGGAFEDFDNDGFEDLVVAFGPAGTVDAADYPAQPDELYRQVAPVLFEPVAATWAVDDDRSNRSVIPADVDGNGWLDLVRPAVGGSVLVNRARCGEAAWLRIHLHDGSARNPDAVGARVVVHAGDERWWRMVSAGSTGFASSGPAYLHVGVGDRETVDDVVVSWPDGEVLHTGPVPTRRRIDVYRERLPH